MWSADTGSWEWNDGTAMEEFDWADGQPSAALNQDMEPYLCMVVEGHMHDTDPPYKFGIMCEVAPDGPKKPDDDSDMDTTIVTVHQPVETGQKTPDQASSDTSSLRGGRLEISQELCCDYFYAGFSTPSQARDACGNRGRLAMPKTARQQNELHVAVKASVRIGNMSENWPRNTVWIAGQWNVASGQWEWDDGSVASTVPWGPGQPSAHQMQEMEPYMCMLTDGHAHDADDSFTFAVFCEREKSLQAALMVCTTDAPGWLRIATVATLACFLIAGIRFSLASSVSVSSLPFSARLLVLPLLLVFASLLASLILGPCLYPMSLPAIVMFVVFLGGLRLLATEQSRCFRLGSVLEPFLPWPAASSPQPQPVVRSGPPEAPTRTLAPVQGGIGGERGENRDHRDDSAKRDRGSGSGSRDRSASRGVSPGSAPRGSSSSSPPVGPPPRGGGGSGSRLPSERSDAAPGNPGGPVAPRKGGLSGGFSPRKPPGATDGRRPTGGPDTRRPRDAEAAPSAAPPRRPR